MKGFVEVQQDSFIDVLILHDPHQASCELMKRNAQGVLYQSLFDELVDQPLLPKRGDP